MAAFLHQSRQHWRLSRVGIATAAIGLVIAASAFAFFAVAPSGSTAALAPADVTSASNSGLGTGIVVFDGAPAAGVPEVGALTLPR